MTVAADFCATLVDEWARAGICHAVVAPGSRSTPLALALARSGHFRLHVRLDERSAAFFAVGIGLSTGVAPVLLTTSGTAAVEVHPAVVEAYQAHVPLIVCTADRPPELHHVGAPQTVEQVGLFAGATRFALDAGVPDSESQWSWRSLASRLAAEAMDAPGGPGPVHANFAFREPLLGSPGELGEGRPAGAPWHKVRRGAGGPDTALLDRLAALCSGQSRGLVVAGSRSGPPDGLARLARALGWPLLADPRSGARMSGGPGSPTIAGADALLRSARFAKDHRPEVILRFGEPSSSKVVESFIADQARSGAELVLVDPYFDWRDPSRQAGELVSCDPGELARALAERVGLLPTGPHPWAQAWAQAEDLAQLAIDAVLAGRLEATEPATARSLYAWASSDSTLVVSSSMPVRDLEWFGAVRARPPRVLANRGANGIDGVVSTTLGVAAASGAPGAPVIGLVGDLAFLHDATALVRGRLEVSANAVIVVVDNGGGGIFSMLPQASELDPAAFERLFGTPQAFDVADLARAAGCHAAEVTAMADLVPALEAAVTTAEADGPSVVVVRTDRAANAALHTELERAVIRAVESAGSLDHEV